MKNTIFLALLCLLFACTRVDAQPSAFPEVYASNLSIGPASVQGHWDEADVTIGVKVCWLQVYVPNDTPDGADMVISAPANVYQLDTETVIAESLVYAGWYCKVNTRTGAVEINFPQAQITAKNPMRSLAGK